MKNLLALIEKKLKSVNTTVTCPVCGQKQSFKLEELTPIRLGTESGYTGTGGMPLVQCDSCKMANRTTLIGLNEAQYHQLRRVVVDAIWQQNPPKYVNEDYNDTIICESV